MQSNIDIFTVFEAAVDHDKWYELGRFLADDASYLNVGGPDPKVTGRDAVINYLQQDVANSDKRYDSRTLAALTEPACNGDRLSRRWRCTYTLADTPDLVIEGEARYRFRNGLIIEIEEAVTRESMQALDAWMARYSDRLRP